MKNCVFILNMRLPDRKGSFTVWPLMKDYNQKPGSSKDKPGTQGAVKQCDMVLHVVPPVHVVLAGVRQKKGSV